MRKILTYLIIVVIAISCSNPQADKHRDDKITSEQNLETQFSERISYVMNPDLTDSLCRSEILRAESDINGGKLVYVQEAGLGFGYKRYETDLKKLCIEKGLEYYVDLIGCVIFEGQTQGCYGTFMDKTLIERFGSDFKLKLSREADSLFLARITEEQIPIQSWDCDVKPKPILETKKYLETTLDIPNLDLKRTEIAKTWPAIDLSIIIEIDGTISKFYSDNYIPNLKHNEKFKNQLYDIAVNYIKENYPKWETGKVLNTSVRTDHNLRITFIGKI